jgi:hypothetical protein
MATGMYAWSGGKVATPCKGIQVSILVGTQSRGDGKLKDFEPFIYELSFCFTSLIVQLIIFLALIFCYLVNDISFS